MFRIPNRLLRLRNYQSEQHKIELQNRYTRNFKTIDYLYILKLTPDQQSRRSSKEEQKKEELLQLKLKKE
tara:strand:+ start:869 stop:1078 length:210 start_codon:yes stop_codon:yes gene_type:complete